VRPAARWRRQITCWRADCGGRRAGAQVARDAFGGALSAERLKISSQTWSLARDGLGGARRPPPWPRGPQRGGLRTLSYLASAQARCVCSRCPPHAPGGCCEGSQCGLTGRRQPLWMNPGMHTPSLRPAHAACTGRPCSLDLICAAQDPVARRSTLLCHAAAQWTVRITQAHQHLTPRAARRRARRRRAGCGGPHARPARRGRGHHRLRERRAAHAAGAAARP